MKLWSQNNKNNIIINEKKRILIVDDDEAITYILKSVLQDDKYIVEVANSGDVALDLFKSNSFDLVISDIKMPGMDGIQLLIQIIKIDSTINVILMTGYGDKESRLKAMSCGAVEYLDKPISINEIKSIVHKYINKSKKAYVARIKSKLRSLILKFTVL